MGYLDFHLSLFTELAHIFLIVWKGHSCFQSRVPQKIFTKNKFVISQYYKLF